MMGHINLNLELYPGIVDLRFRFRFFVHFFGVENNAFYFSK